MGLLEYTIYAVIISFILGVIFCPVLIPVLHKLKYGQTERDDGPQTFPGSDFFELITAYQTPPDA